METSGEVWSGSTFLPQTRHFTPSPKSASETVGMEFLSKKERQRLERQQQREREQEQKRQAAAEREIKEREARALSILQTEIIAVKKALSGPQVDPDSLLQEASIVHVQQDVHAPVSNVDETAGGATVVESQSVNQTKSVMDQLAEYVLGAVGTNETMFPHSIFRYRNDQAQKKQSNSSKIATQHAASAKLTGGSGKLGQSPRTRAESPKPQKPPPNEKERIIKESKTDDELLDAVIKLAYAKLPPLV